MRAAVRDSLRTLATDLLTSPEVPQDQIDDVLALVEAGIPDQIERDVAEFAAHWDRGARSSPGTTSPVLSSSSVMRAVWDDHARSVNGFDFLTAVSPTSQEFRRSSR